MTQPITAQVYQNIEDKSLWVHRNKNEMALPQYIEGLAKGTLWHPMTNTIYRKVESIGHRHYHYADEKPLNWKSRTVILSPNRPYSIKMVKK